jgi:hypothetical protein
LAAKALLAPPPGKDGLPVAGEAFNITDGALQAFWEFSQRMWPHVGAEIDEGKIVVVPEGVAVGMAGALEWVFWVGKLGR